MEGNPVQKRATVGLQRLSLLPPPLFFHRYRPRMRDKVTRCSHL